jgi:ABC-type transport system involved in multi-copper enzyme maturation permease subunit
LDQLAKEYAALSQPEALETATPDAVRRVLELQESIGYPPLVHGYYEGWSAYFQALDAESAYLCGVLIIFGLATLFSGETLAAMAGLTRTMKHGRFALAAAKLIAGGAYGGLCALFCVLVPLVMNGLLFGLDGASLPAQYAAKTALPLTMAQYAGLRIALYMLGGLGMAAVMALLSASMPSVAAPAVAGLVAFLAPYLYGMLHSDSRTLESMANYLPLRLFQPEALMGLQPVMLWQSALYQIPWLGMLWAVIIPLLCYLAAILYLRVHREEPIIQE